MGKKKINKCFKERGMEGKRVGEERRGGREREREREREGGVVTVCSSLVCSLDELLQYGASPCQLLLPAYLGNYPGMNLHKHHIQSTQASCVVLVLCNIDLVESSFKDIKVCCRSVDLKCSIHQLHLQWTSRTLNH